MRRGTIVLVLIGLIAFAIGGCAPSHSDIEKSIKEEMKSKLNVNITAVNLMKQGDGSYIGTATADNGDVYDVTTGPPQRSKIEWRAYSAQATLREGMRTQLKVNVTSMALSKQGDGSYVGTATTDEDDVYDVVVDPPKDHGPMAGDHFTGNA